MPPKVSAMYEYQDEEGQFLFAVERLVPKGFRQWRPDDNGGRIFNMNGIERMLYRLPQVIAAVKAGKWILVVEGEKDVTSLEGIDRIATTNVGGAGKWLPQYNEVLRGAKVAIISDADDPGRRHALAVACELEGVAKEVRLYEPAPPHKDVSDHLKAGLTIKQLVAFDRSAVQAELATRNGNGKKRKLSVVSAREFCQRPGLNGSLQVLGPALNRTMRLTIGASTGDGKTTMGCQMIRAVVCKEPFLREEWCGKGGRALIVDVEQGEETVKQRLRDVGIEDNSDVDLLWEPDGLALDSDPDDRREVEKILRDGKYDVALFDPLYQLHHGEQVSERTAADVMRVLDDWARRFQLAIIVPMHRRKPHPDAGLSAFTMNDISGNGAWVRNSEVVLGLQMVHPGRSRLHFFKDRPGYLPGVGTTWPLSFNNNTHRFARVEEEEERGWRATLKALRASPEPLTTLDLAEQFGTKPETIRNHLKKNIGAYADDEAKPLAEQRWSEEPWPTPQTSIFEELGTDV